MVTAKVVLGRLQKQPWVQRAPHFFLHLFTPPHCFRHVASVHVVPTASHGVGVGVDGSGVGTMDGCGVAAGVGSGVAIVVVSVGSIVVSTMAWVVVTAAGVGSGVAIVVVGLSVGSSVGSIVVSTWFGHNSQVPAQESMASPP